MPSVRTNAVRNALIGDARKALTEAAGSNQIVSKTEAKKLPADVAKAVAAAREEKTRVTVDDAVDKYASIVSRVLAAVDKRGKGTLSEAEAKRIYDPELRARVLDIRASLAAGGPGPVADNSVFFDRLKELSTGLFVSSGGGVDAFLKPFISDTTTSDPLTGEVVQGLLAPQWDTLKRGIWAGGEDLDSFQPGLGDVAAIGAVRLPRADVTITLDEFAGANDQSRAFVEHLRDNLSELTIVDFYEVGADGSSNDCGHSARFIGGKLPDGHLAGVFTGRFTE